MAPDSPRQERQKKLLVMTDDKLSDEMRKYDPSFQKESGFIARTIRERILKIEFPEPAPTPVEPVNSSGVTSP